MTAEVLAWALSRLEQSHSVVIASVISTSGSVPGKTGARLALSGNEENEQCIGTVGGAGLELKVLQRCRELLSQSSKPSGEVLTYGLNKGAKG
ncbi:MAG: XdhC family protein, partial [Euryarchaeota archaeon]|nr:XdhC family protein [Euryarchaeota archaeon]